MYWPIASAMASTTKTKGPGYDVCLWQRQHHSAGLSRDELAACSRIVGVGRRVENGRRGLQPSIGDPAYSPCAPIDPVLVRYFDSTLRRWAGQGSSKRKLLFRMDCSVSHRFRASSRNERPAPHAADKRKSLARMPAGPSLSRVGENAGRDSEPHHSRVVKIFVIHAFRPLVHCLVRPSRVTISEL